MNIIEKAYCRTYQAAFKAAIPLMPYREPKILTNVSKIGPLLEAKKIKSVLLVTDKGIRNAGLTAKLEEKLPQHGIKCCVYDGTVPNPTIDNVEEARKLYKSEKCKAIIAFGGGSSMDCAKAVGARIARPDKSVSNMKGLLKILKALPLLIAVPTTAGTGSETTLAAVITDSRKQYKYPINDFVLIPDYAVLDYRITTGLPKNITATTGMDALTHAVEAYIGNSTTPYTRKMAENATVLIVHSIKRAYNNGNDKEARTAMLKAAFCAGVAFTQSYVGYVHAVAHSLGGQYGIAHGLANAVILPHFLDEYGSTVYKPLSKLAKISGIAPKDSDEKTAAEMFIKWIKETNRSMDIPEYIEGIQEKDIHKMAVHASKEGNPLYPVPRLMDVNRLEKMYYKIIPPKAKTTNITELVKKQRKFFESGKTLNIAFRQKALDNLKEAILYHEAEINEALYEDLGKSSTESYMCETGMTLSEISYVRKHMASWAADKTVMTPLAQFHSKSFKTQSPYGVVLIMSPWNYPLMLCLEPLVGAIAAGNCCILKPSAYSPKTSAVIRKIISETFNEAYIAVVEGGRAENTALLDQKFDYIFFTGGTTVGRTVMEKAAKNLTPVSLEMGGKSPCIVDKTADLKLAAKRLVFGKYLNCGQTCVAPDYLLIEECVKDKFIKLVEEQIVKMYGKEPLKNKAYGKIINHKHFDRICGLIDQNKVVFGGETDVSTLKIAPTVMDNVSPEDAIMGEEIFGPILPVLTFNDIAEAESFVNSKPHPLALYLFTENKAVQKHILKHVQFGGGCINDTIIHLATSEMGFGGVGESGMGAYHGKKSFETFSHEKSIVNKSTWLDLPMRYQPYTNLNTLLLRMFLK